MKKALSILLVLVMLIASLTGCSSGKDETTNNKEDATVENETSETEKEEVVPEETKETASGKVLYTNGGPVEFFSGTWLNPGISMDAKTIYDRLLMADENLGVAGTAMAESYEISEDGTLLEFVLKDNVLWHDGEKVTMNDVKWSIEYAMKNVGISAIFQSTFSAIVGATAYKEGTADEISGIVVDGNKLTITFEKAAPDALLAFTQFNILPQKYFEGVDPLNAQQAEFFQHPIGSGPFMVDEVKMNEYTTLKPFADYYGGVADFSIYMTPGLADSDPNFVTNVRTGLIDYGYTKSVADYNALKDMEGIEITPVNIRYTRKFYLNQYARQDGSTSPLADVRVRQAIKYAIDMESISANLFNGGAVPANSLTPDGPDKVEGLNNYEYNPEKAKQLLAEANWNPEEVLKVAYYYTDQMTVDLMATIQAYLADVGIKMEFQLLEGDLGTLLWTPPADVVNGPRAVDWDMLYAAVAAMSLHEYYDRYMTGSSSNSYLPSDPALDALIQKSLTADPLAQKEAFNEIQKYENDTLFTMALYYQPVFVVKSSKILGGFEKYGNPQFNYNWNIQNWDIQAK
jgi:ABC-type transport system substrate-binding protein